MLKINIKKSLDFIYNLLNTKYDWWNNSDDMRIIENPSYAINKPIPTINYIKKKFINCVGIINLMRRINNLLIPGTDNPNYKYPGGTYIWFKYLKKEKKLTKFNKNNNYPRGTLLLKKYIDSNNQGHVAVIYRASTLNPKIIHAWTDKSIPNQIGNEPGIIIESLNNYNNYFTHICLPKNWLI